MFYCDEDARHKHDEFENSGERFPGLLTAYVTARAAFNVTGTNGFFVSNRVNGRAFRVHPGASFSLWQHAQVYRQNGGQVVYILPVAFVLGADETANEASISSRIRELIDQTLTARRKLTLTLA